MNNIYLFWSVHIHIKTGPRWDHSSFDWNVRRWFTTDRVQNQSPNPTHYKGSRIKWPNWKRWDHWAAMTLIKRQEEGGRPPKLQIYWECWKVVEQCDFCSSSSTTYSSLEPKPGLYVEKVTDASCRAVADCWTKSLGKRHQAGKILLNGLVLNLGLQIFSVICRADQCAAPMTEIKNIPTSDHLFYIKCYFLYIQHL